MERTSLIMLIVLGVIWIVSSLVLALKYENVKKENKRIRLDLEGLRTVLDQCVDVSDKLSGALNECGKKLDDHEEFLTGELPKILGEIKDSTADEIKNGSDIEVSGTKVATSEDTITDGLRNTIKEIIDNELVVSTAINTMIKSAGFGKDGKSLLKGGKSLTSAIKELQKTLDKQ